MAANAVGEHAKHIGRGERPRAAGLLLNPASANRIAGELAQMRGAVMKVGQLLSIEAGDLLPPEFSEVLAGLRDSAHSMPPAQLDSLLSRVWGAHWRERFRSFDLQPFAAASIGQVHEAVDRDGNRLAINIQYAGVADSIDSDVDNVATLLKWSRLLPEGPEIEPLLDMARQQLHEETDYRLEACRLRQYRERIRSDDLFRVPNVIDALSGDTILAMTFVEGRSIEHLRGAPPETRDRLATRMIDLCLHEFLHWGLVQSDPNFANFLYDAERGTIGLLDFGALRVNQAGREFALGRMLKAAVRRDLPALEAAARTVGYIDASDSFSYRMTIVDLIQTAAEPALVEGEYHFAESQLAQILGDKLRYLQTAKFEQRIPPTDVVFLHRKLAGMFLLCAQIHARVDVGALVHAHLQRLEV